MRTLDFQHPPPVPSSAKFQPKIVEPLRQQASWKVVFGAFVIRLVLASLAEFVVVE